MNFTGSIPYEEWKKLYFEIWNEPMISVAKRYNISDTALRKRCKKYSLPIPEAGYWAKQRAGKPVIQKPLPKVNRTIAKFVSGYAIKWRVDMDKLSDEELESNTEFHLLLDDSIYIIKDFCKDFFVQKQLRNPGILILKIMKEADERKQKDREKREKTQWPNINKQVQEPLYPFQVKQKNIMRALRIIEALDMNLYKLEGAISEATPYWSSGKTERKMRVYLLREFYDLKITDAGFDKLRLEFESVNYKLICEDKDLVPVEEQLGQVIYSLCVRGDSRVGKQALEDRIERRRWDEAERKRKIEKMRRDKLDEIEKLIQVSMDWNKAKVLRDFLDAAEIKLEGLSEKADRVKLEAFIERGREVVKWISPLDDFEDDLLGKGTSIWDIL